MADRSISVRLLADVANYVQGLGRAKAATGDLINELSKSEQARANFQQLGTTMAVAGAGIAAGIGLATKAAVDWETAWAGVAKTVDGSEAELAMLEEELRAMARELPATHTEIAAVAEAAGQLGIATGDISEFTRVMIQLGTATNLTAEEAAVALAQMANVMGTSTDEIDNLGASLVDLGNNSATTERDILEMAQRIAGAGATIGLTESDVLAFSAALASVGINAEAGGSAISRAMIDIESRVRSGGGALADLAKVAGMSADEFAAAYEQDAAQAIAAFIAGLGRMQDSGEDVFAVLDQLGFSEIRLRDALLRLASSGDLLTRSLDTGAQAWEENLALAQEAERRYDTTAAKLQVAKNNINDLAITMGETFLPVVGDLADKLGDFTEFLGGIPTPVLQVIGVTAALTAGILLLGGTAITAVTKIAAYRLALEQLNAAGGTTAVVAGRMRGAIQRTMVWAGRAAGAFAAFQIASQILGSTIGTRLNPQLDALSVGLIRWADTGEVGGEAARILGDDMGKLAHAIEALGREDLLNKTGNAVARFAEFFYSDFDDSLANAEKRLESVDAALAGLAQSGHLAEAAAVFQQLADIAEEKGVSVERLMELFPQYAAALEVAAEESATTGDAIAGVGDEAAGAAQEVEELRQAFDDLFDVQLDADRALIAYKQGLADLREEIGDGTASLNVNSQAGRDNRSAVLDQVEAIKQLRDANIDQGMSIDDANAKYDKQLDRLEELLIQQGFNEEAVRDLIDSYRDIPEQVDTEVGQPGMTPALNDVEALKRHYHDLPKRKETRIRTPGFGVVVDAVREYARLLGQIPSSVHTSVSSSGGTRPGIQERWGGVTLRAQRGLLRADIFPPTSPARYMFAEPETGGEAFVPRRGDRERSLAIADVAARWHGGRVVADGLHQAAAELLERATTGGHIFEDLSFRGMSSNLARYNDILAERFAGQGQGDLVSWLREGAGLGGPWQWRGQRQATLGSDGGTGDRGGVFEGTLVLDSGELLGVVRGQIREHDRDLRQRVGAGPRRRV